MIRKTLIAAGVFVGAVGCSRTTILSDPGPERQYTVVVVDQSGSPITRAWIAVGHQPTRYLPIYETDAQGKAQFNAYSGVPIRITADGHVPIDLTVNDLKPDDMYRIILKTASNKPDAGDSE